MFIFVIFNIGSLGKDGEEAIVEKKLMFVTFYLLEPKMEQESRLGRLLKFKTSNIIFISPIMIQIAWASHAKA